ncbi:MAG: DNA polymerase III subunit gamma/tau [Oscillospiraceae bacterium]|nr:DNA polymerase III subunit gamma/tau [Oscillospiraceae bacterium]
MAHQAIYRKWRPLTFEDVTGQTHITQTLKNQIVSGKISHAYLFCGTRGTGKTSAAKIFARAVNCTENKNGSPCNECEICKGIINGSVLDVLEIDAASNNGVDNIRDIKDEINYPPSTAKYRVYIIDEVHMLSPGAFNALLKTLEEPPAHSIFILATTEPHKVPVTILSRCQRFDFRRIGVSDILVRMKQIAFSDEYNITDDALALLASLADGSMRDGLSIMERCLSSSKDTLTVDEINRILGISSKEVVFDTVDAITEKNTGEIFKLINSVISDGKDINVFISDVIEHLRALLVCKISDDADFSGSCNSEQSARLKSQAEKIAFEKLSAASELLCSAQADAKWVKSPRIIYEMAFVKLCRPELDDSPSAILHRISDLDEKIAKGITVNPAPGKTEKTEKTEKKPAKKKSLPSKRVFSPIPENELNASHPYASAAKKWDKVIKEIMKNSPHLITPLRDKPITIDSDGIIIMYEDKDRFSKNIADSMITQIETIAAKVLGVELKIKTVFKNDIEDFAVDFWNLPDSPHSSGARTVSDTDADSDMSGDVLSEGGIPPEPIDPIDELAQRFPEIVEFTDDSEFLSFEAGDDPEQSVMVTDE